MQALPIAFPWGSNCPGDSWRSNQFFLSSEGGPARRAGSDEGVPEGFHGVGNRRANHPPKQKNRQPDFRLAVNRRFCQSVRYRWSITTTWARVALDRGERVLSVTPEMMPWLTAQVMAFVAQELTFPLSA